MTTKKRLKLMTDEIDIEIKHFIDETKGSDDTADYLLSQLVYTVGELPKSKQIEFLNGLINAKQEILWVR